MNNIYKVLIILLTFALVYEFFFRTDTSSVDSNVDELTIANEQLSDNIHELEDSIRCYKLIVSKYNDSLCKINIDYEQEAIEVNSYDDSSAVEFFKQKLDSYYN